MPEFRSPESAKKRGGPLYWLNPKTWWASRRKFRADDSDRWRYEFEAKHPPHPERSTPFSELLAPDAKPGTFTFVILGDTGEGDRSQYSLLPLLHKQKPDFMIINGDVAYPAGELDDFKYGLFEPYKNMGIPIWATCGNHEYYSKGNGREFYDVFCSRDLSGDWSSAGLRSVPQPGMYWELRDPDRHTPLVIIGLDSGKKANLADTKQHAWLESRLSLADDRKDCVIILFHIPGLVNGKDDKVGLAELHRVIARHRSVRLVVCGHIHNHQQYAPETFRKYLKDVHGAPETSPPHPPPHYIVNGNGGATIDGTAKIDPKTAGNLAFPLVDAFPPGNRWNAQMPLVRRVLDRFAGGAVITRVVGGLSDRDSGQPQENTGALNDTDPAAWQSFLLVEVEPQSRPKVSLVSMLRLADLFAQQPQNAVIMIDGSSVDLLDPDALQRCTKELFRL